MVAPGGVSLLRGAWGHAWLLLGEGVCVVAWGACMVAPGGACMVAPWGGVCGCSGGMCGCSWGACMVAPGGVHGCSPGGKRGCSPGGCMHGCSWGGHAWLLRGGGHAWDTTRYGDTVNERVARILLECILVL